MAYLNDARLGSPVGSKPFPMHFEAILLKLGALGNLLLLLLIIPPE